MPRAPRRAQGSQAAAAALLLLLSGCAVRSHPVPSRLAEADALAAAGCYQCLVEALTIYEAALADSPTPAARRRAFRTALLLAVREKELGLPATAYLNRAHELAASLQDPRTLMLLTAATGLPWDVAGRSPEAREAFTRSTMPRGGQLQEWRAALAPYREGDELAAYLDAALACQYESRQERPRATLLAGHADSPVVQFAVAAHCLDAELLDEVLARDGRYVEARFYRGRRALANAATGRASRHAAIPDLTAAYEAFPQSPSVTAAMAGLWRSLNRLDEAVRYYDETLALVPDHREALVGRTVALSYLARHAEGLQTARRIVDLGQWYLGDAHYWSAYNELHLRHLDEAVAEVGRAKTLQPLNSDTFALAGMIHYERGELDEASSNLLEALRLDAQNCTAAWYLGLVRARERAWREASLTFEQTATCHDTSAAQLRREIEALLAALADEAERSALSADYERLIAQARHEEARSCYNAAYASAQAGDRARALAFAGRAAADDEMMVKARELIDALSR